MNNFELFKAAGKNDVAALSRLLDSGADPNSVSSRSGSTPLYNACFTDALAAVRLLLQRGADPNKRIEHHSLIDGRVDRDIVVLMIARSKEVAQALIDAGAEVNVRDAEGVTPLMRAAIRGHPEVVRLLLAAGASPSARNAEGESALDYARERIDFFRQHGSAFKEGHAAMRIRQFEDVCRLL